MKLLLDQGLPRSTVSHLAAAGWTVWHAGDVGLADATDTQILNYARQHGVVLATLDADFHAELAVSRSIAPSVIRIRIEGLKSEDCARILQQVVGVAAAELQAGAAVSVTAASVRVHLLPIGK